MHSLSYKNKNTGKTINLMNQKEKFIVYSVKGLEPVDTTVSGERVVGGDGVEITDVYAGKRNIVISLALRKPIDENRQMLFSYFGSKEEFELHLTVGLRTVIIDGYVEKVEVTENGELQNMQISLVCPDPNFRTYPAMSSSTVKGTAILDFSNHGEREVGFLLSVKLQLGTPAPMTIDVETPNGKHLVLKDLQMDQNDEIVIDTKNKKLERINGSEIKPVTSWMHGNEWLTLPRENGSVTVTVTGGTINKMNTSMSYSLEYWGL